MIDLSKKYLCFQEIIIYTWPDATLEELSELIREALPESRGAVKLIFSQVFPNFDGNFQMRKLGQIFDGVETDNNKTLASLNFEIGDYLDISILPKHSTGQSRQVVSRSGKPACRDWLQQRFKFI